MMTNLDIKFKERSPEDTIQVIKDFFTERGCTYKITASEQSEADTWWAGLEIYFNDILVGKSNGKGATELFSLASAFAESYERFCNRIQYFSIPIVNELGMQLCHNKNNYYISPLERKITFEEIYQYPFISNYFNDYLNNKELIKDFFNLITNNNLIGLPYKGFNHDQTIYLDPRVAQAVNCSIGMSAGNTLQEALNQGLSEIMEHYANMQFYMAPQEEFFIIDKQSIHNEYILQIMSNLEELGYTIYLLDLSYNFKVPAVASILINPKIPNARVNFGSFPVIDIALERILTELYQGIKSYNNFIDNQMPSRNKNPEEFLIHYLNNCTGAAYIPETILLNSKIVPWNSEVFLQNRDISNEELNEYYINFCNKLGLQVNYCDMSLSPNMYAIHTVISNLPLNTEKSKNFKFTSKSLKQSWFNNLKLLYQLNYDIINNKDEEAFENLKNIINIMNSNTKHNGVFEGNLMRSDWNNLFLITDSNILFDMNFAILNTMENNPNILIPGLNDLQRKLRIIQVLRQYKSKNRYSNEEIKIIFKKLTNEEVSDTLLNNLSDPFYCFKTQFCDPFRQLYNSSNYQQMLTIFQA